MIFFVYLQTAEGALLTTQERITPDSFNPLYIWLIFMDCCIRARNFRFKYFATQTLSSRFFPSPKHAYRRYLKDLWRKAEVLKASPKSRIAHFFKHLAHKKEKRDLEEGRAPGEGIWHVGRRCSFILESTSYEMHFLD